ncbi:MAG: nitroreductase family protein [Flavobacteriaceae bacterium]|nr:nitroreductase family protein [Flavobacteriaceae bacterium]
MKEKTVSDAVNFRRSVRVYDPKKTIDTEKVKKCIEQATLAPSSSNLQLWEFYHIQSEEFLKEVAKVCYNQPAAKTAKELVIPVVRLDLWQQRIQANVDFIKKSNAGKEQKKIQGALDYYQKTIPKLYRGSQKITGFLNSLKSNWDGRKKVTYREVKAGDLRAVGHKSTALAAQNFMVSMAAFGYDTCPMEGFDSVRLKALLQLPKAAEISMVIGCGLRKEKGVYGDRFRIPFEEVYFKK